MKFAVFSHPAAYYHKPILTHKNSYVHDIFLSQTIPVNGCFAVTAQENICYTFHRKKGVSEWWK